MCDDDANENNRIRGGKVGSVIGDDFACRTCLCVLYGQEFVETRACVVVYHAEGRSESQIYGGINKIGVWQETAAGTRGKTVGHVVSLGDSFSK